MSWPKADRERAERAWFHEQCNTLCAELGGTEISGRRSERGNAAAKGKPKSLHQVGFARDIRFDTKAKKTQAKTRARQLDLHWFDSHPRSRTLHVQSRGLR